MKNFLCLVKNTESGNYLTINKHEIKRNEETYTFENKTYLIDLDSPHIQDDKGNNNYFYDLDTLEVISLKSIPNPNKFYEPTKLDMFLKKKILQQLWGRIKEQGGGNNIMWIFLILGIGVGFGIGFAVSVIVVPHQTIVQLTNNTIPIPSV